jgi:cytochrome c peroxidase
MKFLKNPIYLLLALTVLFSACKKDDDDNADLDGQLEDALTTASNGVGPSFYTIPSSDQLAQIPQDPKNPLTSEKVALGKLLYHETGLGITPLVLENEAQFSCASCHFASAGFQANRFQGISEGGQGFGINGEGRVRIPGFDENLMDVQPLRTPSAMNTAYQEVMLWNGQFGATGMNAGTEANWTPETPIETNTLGYQGLETQAIAGLKVHRMDVDALPSVIDDLGYKDMFDAAFDDFPESERYSRETTGLAIAAFERTLLANQAPFQKYLRGDNNAMSEQEKRGALLFFADAGCASCHNGPSLANMEFHAIGLKDLNDCPEDVFKTPDNDAAHRGRGSFTKNSADDYKFKVPQLYNLNDSPFYGHGASLRSVRAIVEYKNEAVSENPDVPAGQIAADFQPLGLSDSDINDLVAFLETALYDPNLMRYQPESLPSGNCFPFNDPIAREDLGCN